MTRHSTDPSHACPECGVIPSRFIDGDHEPGCSREEPPCSGCGAGGMYHDPDCPELQRIEQWQEGLRRGMAELKARMSRDDPRYDEAMMQMVAEVRRRVWPHGKPGDRAQ